jgi:hypothetical protein
MRTIAFLALCVSAVLLVSVFVLPADAYTANNGQISQGKLSEDSPEIIQALRTHTIALAESQEARMNGVIRYIDCLNGGSVMELGWIREDYLTAASSIPLMETSPEINAARQDMQVKSVLFSDETANQIVRSGGNPDAMKAFINDSMLALDESSTKTDATHWLRLSDARLVVFDRSAGNRNATLAALSEQGVDITKAHGISNQINEERKELRLVLGNRGDETIKSENSRIKMLNLQFRSAIRECRARLAIQNQIAETNMR